MTSIRKRLVGYLFVALIFFTFIISALTFMKSQEEFTEVIDGNMKHMALAIASYQVGKTEHVAEIISPDRLRTSLDEEEEFLVQVWNKDKELVYSSYPKIKFPELEKEAYIDSFFNEEQWRSYVYLTPFEKIQISQPFKARDSVVLEAAMSLLTPVLVQLPILLGLVYFLLWKSLLPLTSLSQRVGHRNAFNLKPIEIEDVPEEVSPLLLSLNTLLGRLDVSLKAQRKFTADAAHELRTPLTALQLQLDILERSTNMEDRKEAQKKLQGGVSRAIRLVENLLLEARSDTESFEIQMTSIKMEPLVSEAIEGLMPLANDKKQKITLNMPRNSHDVLGQYDVLKKVAENLVYNAILYTPKKGQIHVDVKYAGSNSILTVKDNGTGIEEDKQALIFNRFYRVLGTKTSGSGLGLSIVKNIVTHHKGTIDVQNNSKGGGCTFTVCIPLAKDI